LQEFESLKESPAEGVYIYGLFLDGCAWSGRENKLVEPEPKKLYHPLPVLYVSGVLAKVSRLRAYSTACTCLCHAHQLHVVEYVGRAYVVIAIELA
jgi:hypothetical protein